MITSTKILAGTLIFLAASAIFVSAQQVKDRSSRPLSKRDAKIVAAVQAVLDAQRDAWNRGDIEGYMDGYARSDQTVFVSGDSLTRGWQTVLDRYKKGYNSREKMGILTFSDIEITPVAKDAAIALGKWHLQRAKDEPHGRFTLILRLTKQGWRIVHDHTSSAN
jgi:ketosteroid isomerase-like protein